LSAENHDAPALRRVTLGRHRGRQLREPARRDHAHLRERQPYLDSDTVFGVKESLIYDFAEVDNPAMAEEYGVPNPFRFVEFDVVLSRDSSARG
jgi:hypothetical protein